MEVIELKPYPHLWYTLMFPNYCKNDLHIWFTTYKNSNEHSSMLSSKTCISQVYILQCGQSLLKYSITYRSQRKRRIKEQGGCDVKGEDATESKRNPETPLPELPQTEKSNSALSLDLGIENGKAIIGTVYPNICVLDSYTFLLWMEKWCGTRLWTLWGWSISVAQGNRKIGRKATLRNINE